MVTKADEFLQTYISTRELSKSAKAAQPKEAPAGTDSFLTDITADSKDTAETRKAKRLHKRAEKLGAADTTQDERIAEKEEKEELERQEQEKKATSQRISDRIKTIGDTASNNIAPAVDRIGSIRTVGGIGLLLVILAILMFLVLSVNSYGDTRAKQFWYMLSGRASMQGRQSIIKGSQGASANFGTGGSSQTFSSTTQPTPIVSTLSTPGYHTESVPF